MKAHIDLVTIWTDNLAPMRDFYRDILGFDVKMALDSYVEFKNEGVRFAVCERKVMVEAVGDDAFAEKAAGQIVELAFPCDTPDEVDSSYKMLIEKGATPIKAPEDMPWNQRTALFADPDGNIHEIFANLDS